MKATIVEETLHGHPVPVIDSVSGEVSLEKPLIKRLFIKEKNGLAISIYEGKLYIFDFYCINDRCKIIGEVEVSDELIEKAMSFVQKHTDIKRHINEFENLLK
jgi:hypothetical protein